MHIHIHHHVDAAIAHKLDLILSNQEKIMASLADIVAADAAVKAELDTITTGVTGLVASNKDLSDKLAAAVASNDPAALQAALDQANAIVAEGQAVAAMLPAPASAPAAGGTPAAG